MTGHSATATVEALTAEVRVLVVGNRQITQSVYKQLDYCDFPNFRTYFGRVRTNKPPTMGIGTGSSLSDYREVIEVVGVDHFGVLVRSCVMVPSLRDRMCDRPCEWFDQPGKCRNGHIKQYQRYWYEAARDLPLIVLAGLR